MLGGLLALLLLLPPKGPDPHRLLEDAKLRSEQNLCLLAILEQEPENAKAAEQLLQNYLAQGADPLTVLATAQKFNCTPSEGETTDPERPGAILQTAGLADRKDYKNAYAVAGGKDTIYYATHEGIYADYKGLRVKISGIRAENLIAAEGGVYFINSDQKKVQFLARDGHKILSISLIDAQSFAFFNENVWIVNTEGVLYCSGTAIETPAPIRRITATKERLYASYNDQGGRAAGILVFDKLGNCETVLTSPAFSLYGGEDGCLYYLNGQSYPMRYDPAQKKASILMEKKAMAVTYEEGTIYYLNEKGKIKTIQ